jgi:2,4-dienoyl-CoA reductase-like NADH-dependent reductase (Old Yellow Enzyme family)
MLPLMISDARTPTMTSDSLLLSPLRLGPITLPNRIMVSPMCQYSATDGLPSAWHAAHLGSLAMSGAGLVCLEATGVLPEGRITPGCLGLYNDAQQAALTAQVAALRTISDRPLAIQLAHAGRKASSHRPWEGGALIPVAEGGWEAVAPSAVPHKPGEAAPRAMSEADIRALVVAFAQAARRAREAGFDAIELHMAHGYLLHQFLSPLANRRDDAYGGPLEHRMRAPLAVFEAVRDAAGPGLAVGVRLSATDWAEEAAWDLDQTLVLARRLEALGCDFLDISSGGLWHAQKIPVAPLYHVPFAEAVKQVVDIPVVTVGLITEPRQAEDIVAQGKADVVAMARAFLFDPRWPWRAAAELGATVQPPPQLLRCLPSGHARIFGDVRIAQR